MVEPRDPASAFAAIRDWGFVAHVEGPGSPARSWLAVAIRPTPTYAHFDPEVVEYWVARGGRGRHEAVDVTTPMPIETDVSWGTIRAVDRLGVDNEWVTCGGRLTAETVADGVVSCLFRSEVPILRRGGHSQGWDHGAASLAAFFGRVKVAVDYAPGFEAQFNAACPRVRFAAFIADLARRYRAAPALVDMHPDLAQLVMSEEARLRASDPRALEAGVVLAAAAGLVEVATA